jgi:hypothetical protein
MGRNGPLRGDGEEQVGLDHCPTTSWNDGVDATEEVEALRYRCLDRFVLVVIAGDKSDFRSAIGALS